MINSPAATKNTSRKKGIQHTFIIIHQKKYLSAVKAQPRQEKGVYPHPGKAPVYIFSPRPPADLPARKNTGPKAVMARQLS